MKLCALMTRGALLGNTLYDIKIIRCKCFQCFTNTDFFGHVIMFDRQLFLKSCSDNSFILGTCMSHTCPDSSSCLTSLGTRRLVTQTKQMDIHVRFWDEGSKHVTSRYLTSQFMGHSSATTMLQEIVTSLHDHEIDVRKVVQVSMDCPT